MINTRNSGEVKVMRVKALVIFFIFCFINTLTASENILNPFEVIEELLVILWGSGWLA
jgi:hypothetical protein